MGKLKKAVKIVDESENKSKVKKLLNKPGVSKASAKLNLKEARVPLAKTLKNKLNVADENVNLIDNPKSVKSKNKNSKTVENSVKPHKQIKMEKVPIMKTLKRKSSSDNTVKLPLPKIKSTSSVVPVKKQTKKQPAKKTEIAKKSEVLRKKESKADQVTLKEKSLIKSHTTNDIDESQVLRGVTAALRLAKRLPEGKKKLLDEEHEPIFLNVTCIKIPQTPTRRLRIMLPHTLVTDTDDVVLFVCDSKKGRRQDFEPTINQYQDLLRENGCTQIKDVIPLTQVKTEFDQFELKRKLLSSYDYFLTDAKIAGHLFHLLGNTFIAKRKVPTAIKMQSKNLKLEIDNALKKTSMQLHSHGNRHTVQVAHAGMTKQDVLDNVLHVCKYLSQHYPGGWTNIRSIILKTATSLPIPIYITLKSKNTVEVPVIKPLRPKAYCYVSGELSTAPGNTVVTVRPDGTVTTKRYIDKQMDNDKKDTTSDAEKPTDNKKETTVTKASKKNKKLPAVAPIPKAEDSEDDLPKAKTKRFDDSEEEIEEAEQAYLSQWQEESSIAIDREKKETKKKSKILKKKKTKT